MERLAAVALASSTHDKGDRTGKLAYVAHRDEHAHPEFGGPLPSLTAERDRDIAPTPDELDFVALERTEGKRLNDGLLRAETRGQVLNRILLLARVRSLALGKEAAFERGTVLKASAKVRDLEKIDSHSVSGIVVEHSDGLLIYPTGPATLSPYRT
jgi:hypothetical protein